MTEQPRNEDMIEMTPEERHQALEWLLAHGFSREVAERVLRFATGEERSDLVIPDYASRHPGHRRRRLRRGRCRPGRDSPLRYR